MGQVIANGGICGAFVLLHLLLPDAEWIWLGFAGTLAAANADTWGTELGVLSKRQPRLITSLKPVPRGTAGAVTLDGTLASLGGALFIGLLAVLVAPLPSLVDAAARVMLIGLAGLVGAQVRTRISAPPGRPCTTVRPASRKLNIAKPIPAARPPNTNAAGAGLTMIWST